MEPSPSQYRSYLLRLWSCSDGQTWRAMLEDVRGHEEHRFADLEALCAFLQAQANPDARGTRTDAATEGENP